MEDDSIQNPHDIFEIKKWEQVKELLLDNKYLKL